MIERKRRPMRAVAPRTPDMAADHNHTFPTSVVITTGIFLTSVVSLMACFYMRDLIPAASAALCLLSLPLLPLCFIALVAVVLHGAKIDHIGKMEAWWWLSAPYAATFPLTALIFHIQQGDSTVMLLAMCALVATLSSIVWMLITIYQLAVSRRAMPGRSNTAMMAVVLLACASWAAAYK